MFFARDKDGELQRSRLYFHVLSWPFALDVAKAKREELLFNIIPPSSLAPDLGVIMLKCSITRNKGMLGKWK